MRFPYSEIPVDRYCTGRPTEVAYRPVLNVILKYKNKTRTTPALVDSGADKCIFPTPVGELIGLDVHSVEPEYSGGIDAIKVPVYCHDITIVIRNNPINVRCGFIDKLPIGLLGQEGFFDQYKITFFYKEKYFDITPNRKA